MLLLTNNFIGSSQSDLVGTNNPLFLFNENGHRSKSINDLNTSNYVLFLGCSHTAGYGLEVEETFPHITSNLIGVDYYNMGVGGSGCDVMMYNLLTWLNKYDHKPRFLVIQWPFDLRYVRLSDKEENILLGEGSWSKDICLDFMLKGDKIGYFSLRTKLYLELLEQIKIPKIYISFPEYNRYLKNYIVFEELDKSRDNLHPGVKSHRVLSEKIFDKYLNVKTYSTVREQSDRYRYKST